MIKELVKLSNHLDSKGLAKEADRLDKIITKIAQGFGYGLEDAIGRPPSNTDRPAFSEEAGFVSAGELGYNDATSGKERKSDAELEGLGYTHEDDYESYNDAYDEFGDGGAKSRQDRPLETEELVALMLADKGPGPYKLTEDRLRELSYGKLTEEECQIIGGCE